MRFLIVLAVLALAVPVALAAPSDASCWSDLGSPVSLNGVDFAIAPDNSLYAVAASSSKLYKNKAGEWESFETLPVLQALGVMDSDTVFVAGSRASANGFEPAVMKVTGFALTEFVSLEVDGMPLVSGIAFNRIVPAGGNLYLVADPGIVAIYRNGIFSGKQLFNGTNITAVFSDGDSILVGALNGSLATVTPDLQLVPIRSPDVYKISAIIRASDNSLYIADDFKRIFHSVNNGQAWSVFSTSDTRTFSGFTERGGVMYASTGNANELYATILGQNSWQHRPVAIGSNGIARLSKAGDLIYLFLRETSRVFAFACPNTPPQANAGRDQQVPISSSFRLEAGNLQDAEGDELSFTWTFPPDNGLVGLSNSTASFVTGFANVPGTYVFTLVVTDDGFPNMSSAPSTVKLNVGLEPQAVAPSEARQPEMEQITQSPEPVSTIPQVQNATKTQDVEDDKSEERVAFTQDPLAMAEPLVMAVLIVLIAILLVYIFATRGKEK